MDIKKSSGCIVNIKNPHIIQVENMIVEIKYSGCDKKMAECMLNIFNKKSKIC